MYGRLLVLATAILLASSDPPAVPPEVVFTFQTGGSGNSGTRLAVDAQGNSYVAGSRFAAAPFPITPNAAQSRVASMFVAKIDARGENIVWATYLGGTTGRGYYTRSTGLDYPTGIAVDPQGNVIVVGLTEASDFPVVDAAIALPATTITDGFITKISADGSRLIYSTYLGATTPRAVATDFAGNAYVGMSSDVALSYESRKLSSPGVFGRAVVLKMNPAGKPIYATRFGGESMDPSAIQIDGTGAAIVAGMGSAKGFLFVNPTVSSCYTLNDGSCSNPFVVKLDPSGSRVIFSTMLGGTNNLSSIASLAVDPAGHVYVSGATSATDLPVRDAYQRENAGGSDYFFTKLAPDGTLEQATYLGTDANEAVVYPLPSGAPLITTDLTGRVTAIAVSSSRMGIAPGLENPDIPLFVSRDDGNTWKPSADGLNATVHSIAESERDRTWYAAAGDGVYRSLDGGTSWVRTRRGMTPTRDSSVDVYAIAVDPAHAGVVYAATATGTYKSSDRAESWRLVESHPYYSGFARRSLNVDGNGWVYIGLEGIRRSRDGGDTWEELSEGLERGPTGRYTDLESIVFDPNLEGAIYSTYSGRVFRTMNGGATWTRAKMPGSNNSADSVTFVAGRKGRIFAAGTQSWLSTDAGENWSPLSIRPFRGQFVVDPFRPDTVYVFEDLSTPRPGFVTHNGGETWTPMSTPTNMGIFPDPTSPMTFFVPGFISSHPFIMRFDNGISRPSYSSFITAVTPVAATTDPSGAIYMLSSAGGVTITKLRIP